MSLNLTAIICEYIWLVHGGCLMKSAVLSCTDSICMSCILFSFDASNCFITALLFITCLFCCLFCSCNFQVSSPSSYCWVSLCLGPWAWVYWQGVALVEHSSGVPKKKNPKRETGSVTLCGGPPPLLPRLWFESSDPKLMRWEEWGARAHLLSTEDVLHKADRQAGNDNVGYAFLGSDPPTPKHFDTLGDISLNVCRRLEEILIGQLIGSIWKLLLRGRKYIRTFG